MRIGEITDTNTFTPWIRLYGSIGLLLDSGHGDLHSFPTRRSSDLGTFIVVVGDGNGTLSGTGSYRLTLAKTGDPVVVTVGDEGGPMTNGVMHDGKGIRGDSGDCTITDAGGDRH